MIPRSGMHLASKEVHKRLPTLIMTVGLPRSGKSTWARTQGYPIVNPDSIRLALYNKDFWAPGEKMVWAVARTMVNSLFLAGHDVVILDATNVQKPLRDDWKTDQVIEYRIRYKLVETPKEVCINRAGSNTTLIEVIQRMSEVFDPLQEDEKPYIRRIGLVKGGE